MRMIKLINVLKKEGIIKFRQEFFDVIGMQRQNYRQVLLNKQNFTIEQIHKASKKYNINVNWIFGFENNMFRKEKPLPKTLPKKMKTKEI